MADNKTIDNDVLVTPDENVIGDNLIQRPALYVYVNKNLYDSIGEDKLLTIKNQFNWTEYSDFLNVYYQPLLNKYKDKKNILLSSVISFFCRVPELDNTKFFLDKCKCFKLSFIQLKKSSQELTYYIINCDDETELQQVKRSTIERISQETETLKKYFQNSKDNFLRDVPMVAINCPDGYIPSFIFKEA